MTRRVVAPSSQMPQTVTVDTGYTCNAQDESIVVTAADITVTLPPNPTVGATILNFLAEQPFFLSGGANPLSPDDPVTVGAGSSFLVAYTRLGWLISGVLTNYTPASWLVPDWYLDGVQGNDANTGSDAAHPVQTVSGGIVAKWGATSPVLHQWTKIHVLPLH